MGVNAKGGASCPSQWIYQKLYFSVSTSFSLKLSALSFCLRKFSTVCYFWCRELARGLGEKGVIVFSEFENVIQKGIIFCLIILLGIFFYLVATRKFGNKACELVFFLFFLLKFLLFMLG